MTLDVLNKGAVLSSVLKFASIILCCIYVFFTYKDVLIRAAVAATMMADFFLLLYGNNELGIGIFIAAQVCHAVRFDFKKRTQTLFFEAALALAALAISGVIGLGLRDTLALIYAFAMAQSCIKAFFSLKRNTLPRDVAVRAALGMALFLLCDINVALFNILPRSSGYYGIASVSMWLFYLPSQVLLSTTGKRNRSEA